MGTLQSVARDLQRSAPFSPLRAEGEETPGDGRSLAGYAAVFGQPTEIDSWEGHFVETIRKGAFRKSIRENTPVMQFDHGRHPLIGSIPIGRIEQLREDDQGLYTEARLSDNWLIQPVRDAIAEGSVDGMSFRFEVVREEWRDKDGRRVKPDELLDLLWMPGDRGPLQRELIELKVRELGPVVWPAYTGTSVGVRARTLADDLTRDEERTREIRSSLARDATLPPVPEDPELRLEVATSLLFGRPGMYTRGEHVIIDLDDSTDPETVGRKVRDALQSRQEATAPPADGHPGASRTTGAPPDPGHPPQLPDAPPADGHPSPPPTTTRTDRLRSEIREITRGMSEHLASIDQKEQS